MKKRKNSNYKKEIEKLEMDVKNNEKITRENALKSRQLEKENENLKIELDGYKFANKEKQNSELELNTIKVKSMETEKEKALESLRAVEEQLNDTTFQLDNTKKYSEKLDRDLKTYREKTQKELR